MVKLAWPAHDKKDPSLIRFMKKETPVTSVCPVQNKAVVTGDSGYFFEPNWWKRKCRLLQFVRFKRLLLPHCAQFMMKDIPVTLVCLVHDKGLPSNHVYPINRKEDSGYLSVWCLWGWRLQTLRYVQFILKETSVTSLNPVHDKEHSNYSSVSGYELHKGDFRYTVISRSW